MNTYFLPYTYNDRFLQSQRQTRCQHLTNKLEKNERCQGNNSKAIKTGARSFFIVASVSFLHVSDLSSSDQVQLKLIYKNCSKSAKDLFYQPIAMITLDDFCYESQNKAMSLITVMRYAKRVNRGSHGFDCF